VRTALLGSPPFATPVLGRLLASRHRVALVLTPPDRPRGRGRELEPSPLADLAQQHGVEVLQPEDPHEPGVVERLRAADPGVLVVASYGVILKEELLQLASHGALNVHASLLPRHRGASPIQAAILAGDRESGVSVQRMVAALDEGDVLLERKVDLRGDETAGELLEMLAELGGEAAVEALDRLEAGTAVFTPQDPARASYARKLRKEHGRIDWNQPAAHIERQARALNPWPGLRFSDPKGREVVLLRARAAPGPSGPPGTVLEVGERFVVATGQGALELVELLPAGKRAMAGSEFLRGARMEPGQVLGSPR
jgi:methionyl-tRNA formyltransferase